MAIQGVEIVDSLLNLRPTVRKELVESQKDAKVLYKFDLNYFKNGYAYYLQQFNEEYPKLYFCEDASESALHFVRPSEIEEKLDKAERIDVLVGDAVRNNIIFTLAVPSETSVKIGA